MQPVHRRAVCDGLPDRGDVQAARRHRRLRQGDLHRLQGVHGGLPVRRDLHQPRRPLGREVQHVRPSNRRGSRARLRLGVPNGSDHRRRRQRPDIQGGPTRGARPRRRSTAGEGDGAGCLLPRRAPGHPRPTRVRPPGGRPLRLGHPGRTRPSARHRRPPAGGPVVGCRTAFLRHPPPCAVGLAGQPLHVDQEHRRGRIPGGRAAGADRSARLVGRRRPLGRHR